MPEHRPRLRDRRHPPLGRRRALATLAVLALALLGCDPSHALAIDNQSGSDFTVRIEETTYAEDFGVDVTYYEVPANTKRYAFPVSTGPLEGTVEVFDAACNLVGTIPARNGSVVTIHADLSLDIRYLGDGDESMGSFREAETCR